MNIGTLVGYLRADHSHLRNDFRQADRMFSTFATSSSASMARVGVSVGRVAGLVAGLAVTVGAAGLARSFVRAAAEAEKMTAALDSITKGKGVETFRELDKWAARLPVNTAKAIDTYRMLRSMGLNPTLDQMTILVDTMSALGGSEESMQGIARAMGQIYTKGKLQAEELLQLTERGVPAYEILREKLGLTAKDFENLGKSGRTSAQVIAALFEGLNERFGGTSEKFQKTWGGLMERMSDQWNRFQRLVMGTGVFQVLKESFEAFVTKVEELSDNYVIERWAKRVGLALLDAFDTVVARLGDIRKGTNLAFGTVGALVKHVEDVRLTNLQRQYGDIVAAKIRLEEALAAPWGKADAEQIYDKMFPDSTRERIAKYDEELARLSGEIDNMLDKTASWDQWLQNSADSYVEGAAAAEQFRAKIAAIRTEAEKRPIGQTGATGYLPGGARNVLTDAVNLKAVEDQLLKKMREERWSQRDSTVDARRLGALEKHYKLEAPPVFPPRSFAEDARSLQAAENRRILQMDKDLRDQRSALWDGYRDIWLVQAEDRIAIEEQVTQAIKEEEQKRQAAVNTGLGLTGQLLGETASMMRQFYEDSGGQAEKYWKMYKMFAIAETVVATAQAVMNIWAGPLGKYPPAALAFSTAVGALGAAKIALIQGQEPAKAFAEGGIVTRPTMGLVGEAGPEAIIPLHQADRVLGGKNVTANFNLGVAGGVSPESVEVLRALISREAPGLVQALVDNDPRVRSSIRTAVLRR